MGYDFTHEQPWTEATSVKTRVFVSGPPDAPRHELMLTIEVGDETAGSTVMLTEQFGAPAHKFRELVAVLQSAIEYAETGEVTDGGQ
jgi:hypothetical protein